MKSYIQRRKLKKAKKHILHESRHARYMREDIVDPEELSKLAALEKSLEMAWSQGDTDEMEGAFKALNDQIRTVYPAPAGAHKMRENVEIVVVALAVALGFRTYFIQPYKIPTGSMQPTLNGIRLADDQSEKTTIDSIRLTYLLNGTRYIEVKAKDDGVLNYAGRADNFTVWNIGGTWDEKNRRYRGGKNHKIHLEMPQFFEIPLGESGVKVAKGQVLAAGRLLTGDHILVNKMKYNFARPKRGEITVFSTEDIDYSDIKPDAFYIKRLVGMPGEKISLSKRGYLQVDGKVVENHSAFDWSFKDKYATGHVIASVGENSFRLTDNRQVPLDHGPYLLERKFYLPNKPLELGDEQYLFFGDNTVSSLDGRYFGGVNRESIIGPAFAVYWPFVNRAKWLKNE